MVRGYHRTIGEEMQEEKQQPSDKKPETDKDMLLMHTCACGEQHQHIPGSPSHRDECTSPEKFGDSCCCGTGNHAQGAQHRCGLGPRCR